MRTRKFGTKTSFGAFPAALALVAAVTGPSAAAAATYDADESPHVWAFQPWLYTVMTEDGCYVAQNNDGSYTVPADTEVNFAMYAGRRNAQGGLSSEWYSTDEPNGGYPIYILGWFWWINGQVNPAMYNDAQLFAWTDENPPQKPNYPHWNTNDSAFGFFVFPHTFSDPGAEEEVIGVVYPVEDGETYDAAVLSWEVNVADPSYTVLCEAYDSDYSW